MSLHPLPRTPFCVGAVRASLVAAALCVLPLQLSHAQLPGDLDTSFNSDFTKATVGHTVYAIFPVVDVDTPQTDANGVVTPLLTLTLGGDTGGLERVILPSGLTYVPPQPPPPALPVFDTPPPVGDQNNRIVYTIRPDTYGAEPSNYFVGGLFGKDVKQTLPKRNIFRFTATFQLDPTFDTGQGADDYVTAILPTPAGVVVGGVFQNFNAQAHNHIVRLRDDNVGLDGAIDPTFDPKLNIDDNVLALAQQIDPATGAPNSQILVAGLFNTINGQSHTKLARLNVDGSVDPSFAPTIDTRVNTIAVQPDGKILIGGDFTTVNGVAASRIARLNVDGSYDPTFLASVTQNDPDNVNPVSVYTIVLLPGGGMYVGGNFITVNGFTRRYIARLDANGLVDTSFDPQRNIINAVQSILPSPFNSYDLYVGETITRKVNNVFPPSVVALYSATPPPPPPAPGQGTTVPVPILQARVSIAAKGKVDGGVNATPARNGSFTLTRDAADVSQELLVQLMVGGTAKGPDALIDGFPGVKAGAVITYTFAPGQTTGKIMVMHKANAKAGNKQLTLTVMDPQDGVTTYAAGDTPSAALRVLNQ